MTDIDYKIHGKISVYENYKIIKIFEKLNTMY